MRTASPPLPRRDATRRCKVPINVPRWVCCQYSVVSGRRSRIPLVVFRVTKNVILQNGSLYVIENKKRSGDKICHFLLSYLESEA